MSGTKLCCQLWRGPLLKFEKWGTPGCYSCRLSYLCCFSGPNVGHPPTRWIYLSHCALLPEPSAPISTLIGLENCEAFARATPRCANAPVQQFHTMPLWSRIFWNSAAAALPCPAAKYSSPRKYSFLDHPLASAIRNSTSHPTGPDAVGWR
jgi:hypothetical protein